jgi:hypothetical protein
VLLLLVTAAATKLRRRRRKKVRMFSGNVPEGFEEAFELREMYGSEWSVYTRNTDPTGRYLSVKVFANAPVENKANYWLWWDRFGQRLRSRNKDATIMKSKRPDLYKFVRINLENNF